MFVVWLLDKMARTEEADYRLLRLGAVAAVALLVTLVALGMRRRRGR